MQNLKAMVFILMITLMAACSSVTQTTHAANSVVDNSTAITGVTEQMAFERLIVALEEKNKAFKCLRFRSESDNEDGVVAEVWDFAAVEVHDVICGGDPSIAHVRDRYRVNSNGSVMIYDVVNAEYKPF